MYKLCKEAIRVSEIKLISPMLDNFVMGDPISDRNGVKADDYTYYISANNNYSKYSERQNGFCGGDVIRC